MAADTEIDHRRVTYAMRSRVEDEAVTASEIQVLVDILYKHISEIEEQTLEGCSIRRKDWRIARILMNIVEKKAKDIERVLEQFSKHDALPAIGNTNKQTVEEA